MKLYQILVLSCSLFYMSAANAQTTPKDIVSDQTPTKTQSKSQAQDKQKSQAQDKQKSQAQDKQKSQVQDKQKSQAQDKQKSQVQDSKAKVAKQDSESNAKQATQDKELKGSAKQSNKVTIGQERRLPSDRVPVQQRAMSRDGSTGLHEVKSADVGPQGTLRFGIQVSGFRSEEFLTLGTKERFSRGDFSLSYTPINFLEIYANTRSLSYTNPLGAPSYVQGQGDLKLGAKVGHFWGSLGAGLSLATQLFSDPEGGAWKTEATSFEISALFTADLTKRKSAIPFRFLLDVQFTKENSEALTDFLAQEPSLIQEWGYQSGRYDRLMLNFGIEVPTEYISPFIEYHIGTPFLVEMPRMGQYSRVFAFESVPHFMAGGLRAFPRADLAIELGGTLGLSDAPFTGVSATPPWTIWGGVSYTLDPRPEIVEREIKIEAPPPPKVEPKPLGALLTLMVVDTVDQKAIEGATLTFKDADLSPQYSDTKGRFVGYRLAPKKYIIEVSADGYLSKKVRLGIKKDQKERKARLKLKRDPQQKLAHFTVSLKLNAKEETSQARFELSFIGPEAHKTTLSASTPFDKNLQSGDYVLLINDAEGRSYHELITLGSGGEGVREITLDMIRGRKESASVSASKGKSKSSSNQALKGSTKWVKYNLKRKYLATKRSITFNGESSKLTKSGKRIVAGLAKFLDSETRIQKIVLMIHTHSRGDLKADKRLGYQRGRTIKKLLVSKGVDARRVSIFSYGSEKSLDSNLTRRGRQRNQRVFMRIKSVDL